MKICILIGGEGSTACAILKAIHCGELRAECTGVISHSRAAAGIERTKALGATTIAIDREDYSDRTSFEKDLMVAIDAQAPDVIVLAGFMRILSPEFVDTYPRQILNIHPSLLPKYPGLNTHQRVLDAQESLHGATVHLVTKDCDQGPILKQADIPVSPIDTAESLRDRLQPLEHQLYIDALAQVQAHTNFNTSNHIMFEPKETFS